MSRSVVASIDDDDDDDDAVRSSLKSFVEEEEESERTTTTVARRKKTSFPPTSPLEVVAVFEGEESIYQSSQRTGIFFEVKKCRAKNASQIYLKTSTRSHETRRRGSSSSSTSSSWWVEKGCVVMVDFLKARRYTQTSSLSLSLSLSLSRVYPIFQFDFRRDIYM